MNEQKINLKFCFKLGKTPKETYVMLVRVYEDQSLSMKYVYVRFVPVFEKAGKTTPVVENWRSPSVTKTLKKIITHMKKNMQITGNHQMARIVRDNGESVKEGYIRNGGKEVKLFTSALKAFQCNSRIVMAQRKHLDDFLRCRIIERLESGRTQLEVSEELGITQSVISRL
ncbi:transposable element Tcb1 transposase [Trichonephila clavipes]|nr:transposable element Tcb1 transposase [Trichonephila clavipes]